MKTQDFTSDRKKNDNSQIHVQKTPINTRKISRSSKSLVATSLKPQNIQIINNKILTSPILARNIMDTLKLVSENMKNKNKPKSRSSNNIYTINTVSKANTIFETNNAKYFNPANNFISEENPHSRNTIKLQSISKTKLSSINDLNNKYQEKGKFKVLNTNTTSQFYKFLKVVSKEKIGNNQLCRTINNLLKKENNLKERSIMNNITLKEKLKRDLNENIKDDTNQETYLRGNSERKFKTMNNFEYFKKFKNEIDKNGKKVKKIVEDLKRFQTEKDLVKKNFSKIDYVEKKQKKKYFENLD